MFMTRKNRVREFRLNLGLTQPELALLVGVSKSSISDIERGYKNINAMERERLREIFKLSNTEELYREDG
jgi:DNA-binding XRE family transcriptional regulator